MTNNTITLPEVTTEQISDISTIVDGAILSAVRESKVARVKAGVNNSRPGVRLESRAWQFGGAID